MKSFNYFKPKSLKEASDLILKYGENGHILNGGTDLIVRIRERITTPEGVIDIKEIEGLNDIIYDENYGLLIGATVNLNNLAQNPIIKSKYSVLAQGAKAVGSGQVRNRATLVGNICNASPLADTATPLMVLDAELIVYGPKGQREISIHEFFVWVRKTSLELGEIVVGVKVPSYKNIEGGFQKISRRKDVDLSTVCGSVVKVDGEIKIALGSVAPTPIRCRETEEYLRGKKLSPDVINKACDIAAEEVSPIDDVRSSKEYRLEMVRVLVKRGLNELNKK